VGRYGETLNNELEGRIPVFVISPGLVRTAMTDGFVPDDAPWTPPELAPELVRKLASGRYDALAGRYLHAEHDDVDELLARVDDVQENDLNAIRLRR
jgi:NAD(P)-dependent dehydrogenase (short-subunit alcohol dehydrogenase family)